LELGRQFKLAVFKQLPEQRNVLRGRTSGGHDANLPLKVGK
jgi:hypothetical protein